VSGKNKHPVYDVPYITNKTAKINEFGGKCSHVDEYVGVALGNKVSGKNKHPVYDVHYNNNKTAKIN
jgi:hypothetical protein